VSHHRVTLDDDTAYHMKAKTKKGELDRLRSRIEAMEEEISGMSQTHTRERDICAGLEKKIDDMSREIESLDGTAGSVFSNFTETPLPPKAK
jgi:predicted nuclease with TOPRIM domain